MHHVSSSIAGGVVSYHIISYRIVADLNREGNNLTVPSISLPVLEYLARASGGGGGGLPVRL